MTEVIYTTQETVELQPMDAVGEATTLEQAYSALEAENQELLIEQRDLERELNAEMTEHAETAAERNYAERMFVSLYEWGVLGQKSSFKHGEVTAFYEAGKARIEAGDKRAAAIAIL